MSDLHVRGCDCDDCCPGTKATATRVYSTRAVLHSAPLTAQDRERERIRVAQYRARIRKAKQRTRDELRELGVLP